MISTGITAGTGDKKYQWLAGGGVGGTFKECEWRGPHLEKEVMD